MSQAVLGILDLALTGFASQLQPHLVHHSQATGANGMPEALEPTIRIDRLITLEIEATVHGVLPGFASLGETEIFHQHQFGRRETVVNLGHRDLLASVGDAGLTVGILGTLHHLGEGREVVVLSLGTLGGTGDKRQCLDEDRVIAVLVSVFRATDDGCGSAVRGHPNNP